jgi:hypothetical protein
VQLETLNVDHFELQLDQEAADVEADRFDRTHPDQMLLERNHLGSLGMKRQKRVPLVEAWVLREVLQAQGIAAKYVSRCVCSCSYIESEQRAAKILLENIC